MSTVFVEGFDKYGVPATTNTDGGSTLATLLTQGEWTSVSIGNISLVAGLSGQGQALQLNANTASSMSKTLPTNMSRIIGGVRFTSALTATGGWRFTDGLGGAQCSIVISSSGLITFNLGTAGTVQATGTLSVTAGTTHYLEYDITAGTSGTGNVKIWLDGTQIINANLATISNGNVFYRTFEIIPGFAVTGNVLVCDDIYIFSPSGGTNNAVILNNPRVETRFGTSDVLTNWTLASLAVGTTSRGAANGASVANTLTLQPITPSASCNLSALYCYISNASSGVGIPVIYADSSGVPGALLGSGPSVTFNAVQLWTCPFTSPVAVTGGTQYWIGFLNGSATASWFNSGQGTIAQSKSSAFGSGPPNPAGTMTTTNINSFAWFAVGSGSASNFIAVAQNPPAGSFSFLAANAAGTADRYAFPAPATGDISVYTVAAKVHATLSASGTHNISVRCQSGGTNSSGSLGSVALSTSYVWYGSYFDLDPNTGLVWNPSTVVGASFGVTLDT